MPALAMVRQTVGALLFVRSSVDLGRAIDGVNEFLSYRPTRPSPEDEVLGVVQCDDVDSLPTTLGNVDPGPPRSALALRDAVGLGGVWNLCAFDMTFLGQATTAGHRRRLLLEALCRHPAVGLAGHARGEQVTRVRVLPVFSPAEPLDDVEEVVDDLSASYPQLRIGPRCFLHDAERRGLVPWVPRGEAAEHGERARRGPTPSTPIALTPHLGTEAADDTF